MTNKEKAKAFLTMAGGGQVQEAFDEYVALNFKHHNQYFKGDRQSLMAAMAASYEMNPNKAIEVKQIFEDGSTVITHSLVTRLNAEDLSVAAVHIFRFVDEKISELWDLGQQIEKNSPNQNGLF